MLLEESLIVRSLKLHEKYKANFDVSNEDQACVGKLALIKYGRTLHAALLIRGLRPNIYSNYISDLS